jgi:hypothetical protein
MKKSTFIDYTVILAVLSNRKKRRKEKRNLLFSGIPANVHLVSNQHPAKAVAA